MGRKLIWPLVSSMALSISFRSKYPAILACARNSFKSILALVSSFLYIFPFSIRIMGLPDKNARAAMLLQEQ